MDMAAALHLAAVLLCGLHSGPREDTADHLQAGSCSLSLLFPESE